MEIINQILNSEEVNKMKTKTEAMHATTPWHLVSQYGYAASHGIEYEVVDSLKNGIWTAHCQSKADAEFIVRAVNSHEALQDQLAKILKEIKVYGSLRDGRFKHAENALRDSGYEYYEYEKEGN